MKTKHVIAVGAAVIVVAVPVTAWAAAQNPPSAEPPCREVTWMQEHGAGMGDHWTEMEAFMDEHADEMGSWMGSEGFDGGAGMMGGFGRDHRAFGMGHGAFGMGHGASGMGHGASGMGHGASGMGGSMWQSPGT